MTIEQIYTLRKAIRPLDIGVHSCRYCNAESPDWKHYEHCPYVQSVRDRDDALALLVRIEGDGK